MFIKYLHPRGCGVLQKLVILQLPGAGDKKGDKSLGFPTIEYDGAALFPREVMCFGG